MEFRKTICVTKNGGGDFSWTTGRDGVCTRTPAPMFYSSLLYGARVIGDNAIRLLNV